MNDLKAKIKAYTVRLTSVTMHHTADCTCNKCSALLSVELDYDTIGYDDMAYLKQVEAKVDAAIRDLEGHAPRHGSTPFGKLVEAIDNDDASIENAVTAAIEEMLEEKKGV